MSILAECPLCHRKQTTRNKLCVCGADLDKLKDSKKVRYWINYRLPNGKQKREAVSGEDVDPYSIEDARDMQSKRRVEKRERKIFDVKKDAEMTFRELSDWYLDIEEIKGKASYRQMKYRIKLLNEEIGNKIVSNIIPIDLQNHREKRRKKGVALATIDDEVNQAKMIINKAFENRMISGDTLQSFKAVKNLLKKNANARDEIFSREQFDSLFNHAPQYLKEIMATAFYTGMRKGEILNLTWDKIDLNKRRIRLKAIDTKTGEPRTCPICKELYEIFTEKAKKRDHIQEAGTDNHVFLYNGNPIKDDIKTAFKATCKSAKVPYGRKIKSGLTFHDLRHSFNTYMRKAGVDKEVIKAMTGHNTDSMFTRYNKIDRDDIDLAVDKFETFLNNGKQNVDHSVDQASSSKM